MRPQYLSVHSDGKVSEEEDGAPLGQKWASKKFHQNALVLTDWGTLRVADKQEVTQLVEAQARIVLVQLWSTNCFRALLKRFSSAIRAACFQFCRGRGREFESRRPRHSF